MLYRYYAITTEFFPNSEVSYTPDVIFIRAGLYHILAQRKEFD